MCGTSATADPLLLVHEARVAADELASPLLSGSVAKALDLGSKAGFDPALHFCAGFFSRSQAFAEFLPSAAFFMESSERNNLLFVVFLLFRSFRNLLNCWSFLGSRCVLRDFYVFANDAFDVAHFFDE